MGTSCVAGDDGDHRRLHTRQARGSGPNGRGDPEGHYRSVSEGNEHDQAHEGEAARPFRAIRVVVVVLIVAVIRVAAGIEVSLVSADAEC